MDNQPPVLRVETWECRACGEHVPCRIEITYEPIEWSEVLDRHERFRRRRCICEEPRSTDWKLIKAPPVPTHA